MAFLLIQGLFLYFHHKIFENHIFSNISAVKWRRKTIAYLADRRGGIYRVKFFSLTADFIFYMKNVENRK